MTTEQKAKRFDDALKTAKEIIKYYKERSRDEAAIEDLENIFPELKESEDERIRKALIEVFSNREKYLIDQSFGDITVSEALAWLEKQGEQKNKINSCKFTCEDILALECSMKTAKITKGGDELYKILVPLYNKIHNAYLDELQGEQKPADKVESKFHEGDWIVNNDSGDVFQVTEIRDDEYCLCPLDDEIMGYLRIIAVDTDYHLWTIQDAKDGDVLVASDGSLFIFSKVKNNCAYYHFSLLINGSREISDGKHAWETASACHPATREQHDLLFAKMKEAGYEWNDEKKELRKIEQKYTDKPEPKFHNGEWIVWQDKCYKVNYNGCGYELVDKDGLSTSLEYETIDENAHLWTIEDSKDGDVLYFNDDTIVIFKDLYNSSTFHSYCHIEDGEFGISEDDMPDWWEGEGFQPATKEQRDHLFEKIHEAGYEWDEEKKELKKIGQKPNDRLDPLIDDEIDLWIKENSNIHHNNNDIVELMRNMAYYVATLTRNLYRLKPKWTEEDEENFRDIIGAIHRVAYQTSEDEETRIDWIKSLKQRIIK